MQVLSVFCVS